MAQAAEAIDVARQALADERLVQLVSVIVDRLHPEEIWLFGSRNHCQQAAEKIIMAGLITAGVHPPKEHDLRKLKALLPPGHALVPVFLPLEPLIAYINAFRYPDEPDIPVPPLSRIEAWRAKLAGAKDQVMSLAGSAD